MKEFRSIWVNVVKFGGGGRKSGWIPFPYQGSRLKTAQESRYLSSTSVNRSGAVDISGVYPPITTPFMSSGEIDYGRLQENMSSWNSIDFAGYVVMGSNGEAVSLKHNEKLELVRSVKKMSKPTSKIIAGLGLSTTEQTIEICNLVADEKTADAGLIVSPSFYKGQMTIWLSSKEASKTVWRLDFRTVSDPYRANVRNPSSIGSHFTHVISFHPGKEGVLRKFYEDVADKSKLPIIVYSVPVNTSLDLSTSLVTALAEHPNIIGLKDSGGDITKISEIVHKTPEDFQVLAGSAGFLLPALLMGCVGGIAALANVLGEQVALLYRLFERKEMDKAVALQRTIISPNIWVTRKLGVPGLKAAMDFKGLYGGPCRLPLQPLGKDEQEGLRRAFEQDGYPLSK